MTRPGSSRKATSPSNSTGNKWRSVPATSLSHHPTCRTSSRATDPAARSSSASTPARPWSPNGSNERVAAPVAQMRWGRRRIRAPTPSFASRVERMTTSSVVPVGLRNGIEINDPLRVVLGYLESWRFEIGDRSFSFEEADLRLANRGGARISAAEIAAILARRPTIQRALQTIAPDASLTGAATSVPWQPLGQLFEAFADIRGVGFAKMTKALHPKRPALIPMLDSVVRRYLAADDPGDQALFGERALALVRGYKRDLDLNRVAVRALRQELVRRGYDLSEVRIVDLLIWSVEVP